jgi:hypothetical protein
MLMPADLARAAFEASGQKSPAGVLAADIEVEMVGVIGVVIRPQRHIEQAAGPVVDLAQEITLRRPCCGNPSAR